MAGSAAAWGHPFQFTEADVLLSEDGTVTAVVPFHIDALLAGVPIGDPTEEDYIRLREMDPEVFQARMDEVAEYLRTSVRLKFDGEAIEPEIRFPELEEQRAEGVERPFPGKRFELVAKIPPDTSEFVFTASPIYRLVFLRLFDGDTVEPRREEPVNPGAASIPYNFVRETDSPSVWVVGGKYVQLGFLHIVPEGLDHILFVLGLFLLNLQWRPLLWQITAFTVAHTVTLALAALGLIALPEGLVEPLIALSIAYVAIENCMTFEMKPWRPAVVFGFGLIHGLGFAGVLGGLGLPEQGFMVALLGFNLGVELGQVAVLLAAFIAVGAFRNRPWYRSRITIPASLAIAAIALMWTVERVLG